MRNKELTRVRWPWKSVHPQIGVKKTPRPRESAFAQARTIKYDSLSVCAKSGEIFFRHFSWILVRLWFMRPTFGQDFYMIKSEVDKCQDSPQYLKTRRFHFCYRFFDRWRLDTVTIVGLLRHVHSDLWNRKKSIIYQALSLLGVSESNSTSKIM